MFDIVIENFITAYFVDNERTQIVVEYTDDAGQERVFDLPADPDNHYFQRLMEVVTVDDIEAKTIEHINAQVEAFKAIQRQIVIQERLQTAEQVSDASRGAAREEFLNFLLMSETQISENDLVNDLFELKLKMFDKPEVQQASAEVKESIRLATTPLAVLSAYQSIS